MRIGVVFALFLGCASLAMGQEPVPAPSVPPLPSGPLLKRAPDYSTWSVTSEGTPVAGQMPAAFGAPSAGHGGQKQAVVTQLTVIKTGSTIVEQYVDANGQRYAVWHVAGVQVSVSSGAPTPVVRPDSGGEDIYSTNFAVSDFAGLDWISAGTYSGIVKYQGSDCIVFNSNVSPLEGGQQKLEAATIEQARALGHPVADAVKVPATAYIDLETRLPLFVQFGGEKCTYQYGPPPRAPLQLPAQLAGSVAAYQQKIRALSGPAGPPF